MSAAPSERGRGTLPYPLVIMVTDRRREPGAFLGRVRAAAAGGVSLVQLRERGLEAADLLALAQSVKQDTALTATRVVVNDRLDVAVAAKADGVHLPGYAPPAARVRAMSPAGFLIGRSIHSIEEAVRVDAEGSCDYLIFGTVFETASKPAAHPVAGVERLAEVCAAVRLPVAAIGGITVARLPQVVRAGAAGIAALDLFATRSGQDLIDRLRDVRAAFAAV